MDRDISSKCDKGIELLSYLFDELPARDRERVEVHLAECDPCVDDFAALSQARYPVHEWKQLEFDPLPTPELMLPESRPSVASYLGRLIGLLTSPAGLKMGGAFATIAILATVGILTLRTPQESISADNVAPIEVPVNVTAVTKGENTEIASDTRQSDVDETTETAHNGENDSQPIPRDVRKGNPRRHVLKSHTTSLKAEVAVDRGDSQKKSETENKTTRAVPKVPVLAQFDEVEDKSLRLAELFENIESRD